MTVLMVACGSASRKYDDMLNCIDQLLDKGAQVNAYNGSHMSPLMYAARCGYSAVVQRLIEKKADLDEQDNLGYTALMHAVEKGRIGVVRVLLKAKADVGKQTLEGNDATYLAFIGKNEQNKAGVTANSNDANQDDDEFNSDFVWNIEEEFHSNPVIELPGKSLFNSSVILLDDFRHAAIRNSTDVLEKFLQHVGVDIESRLKSGWTVLMHAAYAAKPDSVRCLLKHGADPNAHKNDMTVLMVACGSASRKYDDMLNCIDQLLDKGAQVNAYNGSHMSPLMYAARCGYSAVVQRLIEKKADLDEQDNLGYTALMHAVEKGRIGVVRVLLKAKADVGKQTLEGNDATYLAFIGKNEQLQKMLENGSVDEELGCSDLDKTELAVQREDLSEDQLGWSKAAICDSYTLTNFDLLLSGLQLNELNPIFQERNISYEKFLRLTDGDLIEMGIHQLGVRKKILDALKETHKKSWETSSLTPIDYNRKITCLDSTGLVANVHFHAVYIASTVGYISDQLSADKDIVLKAPEKEVTDLCINAEETIVNVKNLYEELHILNTRLAKICRYHDFSPPDFIKPSNTNSRITKRRLTLAAVVLGCFMTAAWLKRETVASIVTRTLVRNS